MIDFDALVIAVGQATFAIPIKVTPNVSQPGAPAYPARGVYSSDPLEIDMQDGSAFSDQKTTLSVRHAEFMVPVVAGDFITLRPPKASTDVTFKVADVSGDGQGADVLLLRRTKPERNL